ncbi:MAG: ShlB/FhaC/HecB family hemolysin secretion/activation protein [bacterium]
MNQVFIKIVICFYLSTQLLTAGNDEVAFQRADQSFLSEERQQQALKRQYQQAYDLPAPLEFSQKEVKIEAESWKEMTLKKVQVEGANMISKRQQRRLNAAYLNRVVNAKDLQMLQKDYAAAIMTKGYITTRVWLLSQDITKGILRLKVIPGRITHIEIRNKKGWALSQCLVIKKGQLLNIRDLETSLANLNRLSSQSYQSQLIADPAVPGGTIVVLENQPKHPVSGIVSYSNMKKKDLYPDNLLLSMDQLLGLQEQWQLSLGQNTTDVTQYMLSGLTLSLPVKRWVLGLGFRKFKHSYLLKSMGQRYFHYFNTYQQQSIDLNWRCFHWPKAALDIKVAYKHKEQTRHIENTFLIHQHQRLEIAELSAVTRLTHRLGTWHITPLIRWGQTRFPSLATDQEAEAQFTVGQLSLGYQYHRRVGRIPLAFEVQYQGFYAEKSMLGTEQFSLGDQYSLRGFDGFLQGDKGYSGGLSLRAIYHNWLTPKLSLEGGKVSSYDENSQTGTVLSWAVENQMSWQYLSATLGYSRALKVSEGLKKQGQVWGQVKVQF